VTEEPPPKPATRADPNDYAGPRNVLRELHGGAVAANEIVETKAKFDENFPEVPLPPYVATAEVPPMAPFERPPLQKTTGPVPTGRPIKYKGGMIDVKRP